jgi:hypothetical protein
MEGLSIGWSRRGYVSIEVSNQRRTPQVTDDTWISADDPIIENAQLSPVAARIATGSITVMNAEVLSHEP